MFRTTLIILGVALLLDVPSAARADESHRSPLAIAVCPTQPYVLVANHTAGTIGLIESTQFRVCCEIPVGHGPADIVWLDEHSALVTLLHDDRVTLIQRDQEQLTIVRSIFVGDEPRGLSVSKNRRRVYVSLGGEDAVAVMDLDRIKSSDQAARTSVFERLPVGGIPRSSTVSPDEKWLVTCCSYPCEVFVHDAETLKLVSSRKIFDGGFNPGRPAITGDSNLVVVPSAVNRAFSVTDRMIDIGWVIDNRLSKLPLPDGEPGDQKQLGLDIRGKAVGDANAVAVSPDGQYIAVTCGGTHELLALEFPTIDWPKGDPGDFLPEPLRKDPQRFRRIKLGGRPVDVKFIEQRCVVVANYLSDSLQVVDLEKDQIINTIPLGGPRSPDLARRGEVVFYDADRSMHSWFSCHTCHTDGHTSAQLFDTRNDQSYGTPKLTPSLRGVAETGPWTWHGWQTDLKDAMKRSLKDSMSTEHAISNDDLESLVAYLRKIEHPHNPRADSNLPTVTAGRILFEGRAGCVKCHAQPTFTSTSTYDGAVEDPKDKNKLYNPPSLRGVSARRRFLHTGKAKSLEQVLTKFHRPEDLVGESLSDDDISAIIDYLKTL